MRGVVDDEIERFWVVFSVLWWIVSNKDRFRRPRNRQSVVLFVQ